MKKLKTHRITAALMLTAAFALTAHLPASAHDKSLHKGKATVGEITEVSSSSFEMKTDKGAVTVLLSDQTKLESGDAKADKSNLVQGVKVQVYGSKLSGGKIAAREVRIEKQSGDDQHQGESKEQLNY